MNNFFNDKCNKFVDLCNIDFNTYSCRIKNLLNSAGFSCIIDTRISKIIEAISVEFHKAYLYICENAKESNPCTANENLEDWKKILGLDICPINLTQEQICEIFKITEINCDTIGYLASLEGYELLDCSTECGFVDVLCDSQSVSVRCDGFPAKIKCKRNPKQITKCSGFGQFTVFQSGIYAQENLECKRKYSDFPCINCCENDQEIIDVENIDLCERERVLGTCYQKKKFLFPAYEDKLCNPFSVTLTLAGKNPCKELKQLDLRCNGENISFACQGETVSLRQYPQLDNFGFSNSFNRTFYNKIGENFSLCLLESFVPMYLDITYKFEEDC